MKDNRSPASVVGSLCQAAFPVADPLRLAHQVVGKIGRASHATALVYLRVSLTQDAVLALGLQGLGNLNQDFVLYA